MSVNDNVKYFCCIFQKNFMNELIFKWLAVGMILNIFSLTYLETPTDDNEISFCSWRIFSLSKLISTLQFWTVNFIHSVDGFDKGAFGFAGTGLIASFIFTTLICCEDFWFSFLMQLVEKKVVDSIKYAGHLLNFVSLVFDVFLNKSDISVTTCCSAYWSTFSLWMSLQIWYSVPTFSKLDRVIFLIFHIFVYFMIIFWTPSKTSDCKI